METTQLEMQSIQDLPKKPKKSAKEVWGIVGTVVKWVLIGLCALLLVSNVVCGRDPSGAQHLHFRDRLWPDGGNLRCHVACPHSHGNHDESQLGPDGTELPSVAVCPGLSGIPYHRLRGDLRGAGTYHRGRNRRGSGYLDVQRLYGAAVLFPVQIRRRGKANFRGALIFNKDCFLCS